MSHEVHDWNIEPWIHIQEEKEKKKDDKVPPVQEQEVPEQGNHDR